MKYAAIASATNTRGTSGVASPPTFVNLVVNCRVYVGKTKIVGKLIGNRKLINRNDMVGKKKNL